MPNTTNRSTQLQTLLTQLNLGAMADIFADLLRKLRDAYFERHRKTIAKGKTHSIGETNRVAARKMRNKPMPIASKRIAEAFGTITRSSLRKASI